MEDGSVLCMVRMSVVLMDTFQAKSSGNPQKGKLATAVAADHSID